MNHRNSARIIMIISTILVGLASTSCKNDSFLHKYKTQHSPIGQVAEATVGEESCPSTEEEWMQWRDREFKTLASWSYTTNARHIATIFEECRSSLDRFPKAKSCMANLMSFTKIRLLQSRRGHSFGLETTDTEYFESVAAYGFFDLPEPINQQSFLKLLDRLDDPTSKQAALDLIDQYNSQESTSGRTISRLFYRSKVIPSPDDAASFSRLLLHIPHADFDQFIQFTLRDDQSKPHGQGISIVAVQKNDMLTKEPLSRPLVYFNDLYRVRNDSEIKISTRYKEAGGRLESCVFCHKSAVIPVYPDLAYFDSGREDSNLRTMNKLISQYSTAIAAQFPQTADGPALGDGSGVSDEFIRKCANNPQMPQDSVARVRESMNCASCHNQHNRGALTLSSIKPNQLPNGGNLIRQAILETKTMPPNSNLTTSEREILFSCLTLAYTPTFSLKEPITKASKDLGQLENWLLQPECTNANTNP